MAQPLLKINDLFASVDDKLILKNVNLELAAGETHVLMGPNGTGKSTFGHVVMGDPVYTVNGGSIEFDGQDITGLSPDKRSRAGLFLSFQAPVEIPGVPLSSFLRASVAGREGADLKGKQFRKLLKDLCEELDMDPAWLDRELGVGFSGGEKKKVEMLQLLLLQPKLAILDETDSGLDVDALGLPPPLQRHADGHHPQHAHPRTPEHRPRPRHDGRAYDRRRRCEHGPVHRRERLRAVRRRRSGSRIP